MLSVEHCFAGETPDDRMVLLGKASIETYSATSVRLLISSVKQIFQHIEALW